MHEGAEAGRGDGLVEVGIGEDDQRRLAAELEQGRLQVLGVAFIAIRRPTLVEPVKFTRRTAG